MGEWEQPLIRGMHFATALATDASVVHAFCQDILGLALVKRTVADDDPSVARLIYGSPDGRPGTLLSFFVASGFVEGRPGTGQTVQVVLSVPAGSRDAWRQRLAEAGIDAREGSGNTLFFNGPDGLGIGLIAQGEGGEVPELHGAVLASCDPAATRTFVQDVLGLKPAAGGFFYAGDDPLCNALMVHPGGAKVPEGVVGAGTWHHLALRVAQASDLDELERRLQLRRLPYERAVQPWFETVSFQEPGGALLVCATEGPGMNADEPGTLGRRLCLPAHFEPYRERIVAAIGPVASGEGTPPSEAQP